MVKLDDGWPESAEGMLESEDVRFGRCPDLKMWGEQMWSCEDVNALVRADVRALRYKDVRVWRCEGVRVRKCEGIKDVKIWGCQDKSKSRCEDVKMWWCKWADVEIYVGRCEKVKMWGCEDVKMWGVFKTDLIKKTSDVQIAKDRAVHNRNLLPAEF